MESKPSNFQSHRGSNWPSGGGDCAENPDMAYVASSASCTKRKNRSSSPPGAVLPVKNWQLCLRARLVALRALKEKRQAAAPPGAQGRFTPHTRGLLAASTSTVHELSPHTLPRERRPSGDVLSFRLVQQSRTGFISAFVILAGCRSVRQAGIVVGTS